MNFIYISKYFKIIDQITILNVKSRSIENELNKFRKDFDEAKKNKEKYHSIMQPGEIKELLSDCSGIDETENIELISITTEKYDFIYLTRNTIKLKQIVPEELYRILFHLERGTEKDSKQKLYPNFRIESFNAQSGAKYLDVDFLLLQFDF